MNSSGSLLRDSWAQIKVFQGCIPSQRLEGRIVSSLVQVIGRIQDFVSLGWKSHFLAGCQLKAVLCF